LQESTTACVTGKEVQEKRYESIKARRETTFLLGVSSTDFPFSAVRFLEKDIEMKKLMKI